MSFVKEIKGITFESNRFGYICALSRKESTSDLRQDDNYVKKNVANNPIARKIINNLGYMGYFQFGTSALQAIGYKNSNGSWSGVNGAVSQESFLNSREMQIKAVNRLIDYNCKLLRNNNINEYYGKTINGIELTESGVIAGCHLVGLGGLAAFLDVPNNLKFIKKKINGKWVVTDQKHPQYDGNNVHISKYIEEFNNYDLESCCQRKVRIIFRNAGTPLVGAEVTIKSIFSTGKLYGKQISVQHITDKEGKIPVIVRHPNTKIILTVQGKDSEVIEQEADKVQNKILNIEGIVVSSSLEKNNSPQPKPQQTKSPQEARNEQSSADEGEMTVKNDKKEVTFNIQIVEGDTGKSISNMGFFLTYKGNIKKHVTDNNGIKQGVTAEVGEDIEVTVSGDGSKQKIHHFKVEESLNNQTLKVKLPVHGFQLLIKNNGEAVPNTTTTVFYRGRQIIKKTNTSGIINLKMMVGFVYGFGVGSKELAKARVVGTKSSIIFNVNSGFVKESKQFDLQKHTTTEQKNNKSESKAPPPTTQNAPEVKKEVPKTSQQNTHTENGGKPLTTVSNQAPPTSDTTRYHIYSDGKIKRENAPATGFAEYIYYDKNGQVHNIGKTVFIRAPKRKSGNALVGGNVYLIDQRKLKSYQSRDGKVGYSWDIYLPGRDRYYIKGDAFAAIIGAMCSLGYGYYQGSGFSDKEGRSVGSVSHYNGINGDFRYLGIDGCHKDGPVLVSQKDRFDWNANVNFVNALYLFGYKAFGSQIMRRKGQQDKTLPHVVFTNSDHDNHLHIQGYQPNIQDI